MTEPRCDTPGKIRLLVRWGCDGRRWLNCLTRADVGYSLAQSVWDVRDDAPRQLAQIHAAFVGVDVAMALVTDLSGDLCDVARSHHTCCTRTANKRNGRRYGTVWDNRGLQAYEVVGWEGVLAAVGIIAGWAACETGTDDPYRHERFFGPKEWGKPTLYRVPDAIDDRSTLPDEVELALIEPDIRPADLTRAQLIHEAEAAIDHGVARFYSNLGRAPRRVRPFHRRKHAENGLPSMSADPRFIGPEELVAPLAEEADMWLRFYRECRDEFPEDQYVVFPRGTIRFRRLGAACDPFTPVRTTSPPPNSKIVRGPRPPMYNASKPALDLTAIPTQTRGPP